MDKEDYMSVYLQGRYDERDVWKKIIKDKKEKLKRNINWINHDNNIYAIKILDDLLKGEI